MVHFQEYSSRQEPLDMDVSENSGTPKSSMLIRFFIVNHPFWGSPIFGKHPNILSRFRSRHGRPSRKSILFGPTLEHALDAQRSIMLGGQPTADSLAFGLSAAFLAVGCCSQAAET